MFEMIQSNFMGILGTVITAILSFIGISVRNTYKKYINTKIKKDVVKDTVDYVEQISKSMNITNKEKFEKAKIKSLEWLFSKKIKISDDELEILIESAVNSLNQSLRGLIKNE